MSLKQSIILVLASGLDSSLVSSSQYKPYETIYRFHPKKARGSIRAILVKLVRSGQVEKIIKNGVALFRLNSNALRTIQNDLALSPAWPGPLPQRKWDGKWCILILRNGIRVDANIKAKLDKLAFARLKDSAYFRLQNKHIYISPFKPTQGWEKDLGIILETNRIAPFDNRKTASMVWDIETIYSRYNDWIRRVKQAVHTHKEFLSIVEEYEPIIRDDPMLPKELLPRDWPFERARKTLISFLRRSI